MTFVEQVDIEAHYTECRRSLRGHNVLPGDAPPHGPVNWPVRCYTRALRLLPDEGLSLAEVDALIEQYTAMPDIPGELAQRAVPRELREAIKTAAVRVQGRTWTCDSITRVTGRTCGRMNYVPVLLPDESERTVYCSHCHGDHVVRRDMDGQ